MNHVMPTAESTATATIATADAPISSQCAACPHPIATHDRISLRFCTATTSEKHSRGCVCGS
jgi:hypothetical protein